MDPYQSGQAIGRFTMSLGILVAIIWGVIAIIRSARKPSPAARAEAYWSAAFALLPREQCGPVWQAAHMEGHYMAATITSTETFALNYQTPQAPPLRVRPEGMSVTFGSAEIVIPGANEPMVEATLSSPVQPPVTFRIAQSGATALAAWAVPTR